MNFAPLTPKIISPAAPGRPKVNVRPFIIKPTDRFVSGAEYLNVMPAPLKAAAEKYLKSHQLPPALAPKYLRKPAVMDEQRKDAISKGWRKPRSRNA